MEDHGHSLEESVKRVDVDADGDLILVLGVVQLKVSSKSLSLASNVFKAMFKQGFTEGNAMHTRSTNLPSIKLPDDNVDAMTTICRMIHHNPDHTSTISIDRIKDVAITADKYDSIMALSPWSALCMNTFREVGATILAKNLLFPAFAFNDHFFFQDVTRQMVYSLRGFKQLRKVFSRTVTYGIEPEIRYLLPEYLLETIVSWEWKLKRKISRELDNAIAPLIKRDDIGKGPIPAKDDRISHYDYAVSECDCQHTGQYIQALCQKQLWPSTTALNRWSIDELLDKIESVQVGFKLEKLDCTSCELSIESFLKPLRKEASSYFRGLCLDCVRRGKDASQQCWR